MSGHPDPECMCDACAMFVLLHVAQDREGLFADPYLNRTARHLVTAWVTKSKQREARDLLLLVGCPYCGQASGQWCRTASGNVYDETHGPAYFHAARHRALADLDADDDALAKRDADA